MPTGPLRSTTPTIDIYVRLAQYPVLCDRIRLRMREELFTRGVTSKGLFEQEVKRQAIESQRREGLDNPHHQEDESAWQHRLDTIRDYLTDAYFANNLGSGLLEQLVEDVLRNQHADTSDVDLNFNPEIAPWTLLFQQGELFDNLPPPEKEKVKHHLEEIKVVLIKRLMSDQLTLIAVAKKALKIRDLRWIHERIIGAGKIGGKASGMLLAWKVLQTNAGDYGPEFNDSVGIPDTYFIGSEMIYEFLYHNQLIHYVNQKYLPPAEREAQFPHIVAAFMQAEVPDYFVEQLRDVLVRINGRPFIVRSSSLLEDHLDYSFAGKYATVFCPNQGSEAENMAALLDAVRTVYASTFNPRAMADREVNDLIDYDERMAVMIQPLVGEHFGSYFFPTVVGVGLSENPLQNDAKARTEDGCLRLIWGFAERVTGNQFLNQACVVALSHPNQRLNTPEGNLYQATQQDIKVVNLESNQFETLPVQELLTQDYPNRTVVATPAPSAENGDNGYVINFERLTREYKFVQLMRYALQRLQKTYGKPVELEFTLSLSEGPTGIDYELNILQCHAIA